MDKKLDFSSVKLEHFQTLSQYVPIVARVHGKNHPEFLEVHKVFKKLFKKIEASETPQLGEEFKKLREITNNYKVPSDVCESYEAVYKMLSQLDEAYHA